MSDRTNFDELFKNDFFKDEFDTRVEKHLKSYNRRIEALEEKFELASEIFDSRLEWIKEKDKQIAELKEEIQRLDNKILLIYQGKSPTEADIILEKLKPKTEKKEACKHKYTSCSSDPLIWYVCHDCGARLNQVFEEITSITHALHKRVLEGSGGEKLGNAKDMDLPNGKQYQIDSKLPEPIGLSEYSANWLAKLEEGQATTETDPTKGKQWVRYEVVNRLLEKQSKEQIAEFIEDIQSLEEDK